MKHLLLFLKELPAYVVIFAVFIFVFMYYIQTRDPFVQRLVDAAMGSLFTALVVQRRLATTPPSELPAGFEQTLTTRTQYDDSNSNSSDESGDTETPNKS